MNTIQLNEILSRDSFTKNIFLGTFAFDNLPTILNYPACLIINNQSSTQPGGHWIAAYFNKNRTCEFFDSYGNSPAFFELSNYLKHNSTSIFYNKTRLQSYSSENCGYFCILFLIFKSRNFSLDYFLKNFREPNLNDNMINNLKQKYL